MQQLLGLPKCLPQFAFNTVTDDSSVNHVAYMPWITSTLLPIGKVLLSITLKPNTDQTCDIWKSIFWDHTTFGTNSVLGSIQETDT